MRYWFPWLFTLMFTLVTAIIAVPILGDQNFYSDDLSGHIALVERLAGMAGDPWFYDRAWFGGFAAFEFYGFVPHWLAAQLAHWMGGDWFAATRAVHGVMAGCIFLLPVAAYWFVSGWHRAGRRAAPTIAGGTALAVALFLAVREPGVPAGMSYMVGAGVYGQLPGWILMMVYLGALGRAMQRERVTHWGLAVALSMLIATHPLTGVAALLIAGILLVSYGGWRPALAHMAVMSATSAWFWLPILAWAPEYGASNPIPSNITPVSILLDGWLDFLNGVETPGWLLLAESALALSLVTALLAALFRGRPAARAALLLLLAGLLLAGTAPAQALPIELHYHRLIVTISVVLSLMAVSASVEEIPRMPERVHLLLGGMALFLAAQVALVSLHIHPRASTDSLAGLVEEQALLDRLDALPKDSRILFEYPRLLSERDTGPGKFVESRLWSRTGIETVNGLLIQSSRAYRFHSTILAGMNAGVFGFPPFGSDFFTLGDAGVADFLRRNSISHVVAARAQFADRLSRMPALERLGAVGRYTVFAVDKPHPKLREVSVPVIGYADLHGTLPFRFLDTYVELHRPVSGRVRIIALDDDEIGTVPVDGLVINMDREVESSEWRELTLEDGRKVPALGFSHRPNKPERVYGRTNYREKRRYNEAAAYLSDIGFDRWLYTFGATRQAGSEASVALGFDWSRNGQTVSFSALRPGRWYEFAYSAFPAWRAEGGRIHAGSAGHMFVRGSEPAMRIVYDRWRTTPVLIGYLVTALALLVTVLARLRWPRWDAGTRAF